PRWREQQATLQLAWRNDLPGHVHGRIRGDRITLSRELLEGMLAPAGSSAATAAHATEAADVAPRQRNGARASPQRAAVAALLHELAHHRDRRHGLSRDPRLLDLAGWQL